MITYISISMFSSLMLFLSILLQEIEKTNTSSVIIFKLSLTNILYPCFSEFSSSSELSTYVCGKLE
jgi:hypothetical protein